MKPGLLFAGTERSLFVSFDDGENWQVLNPGPPRDLGARYHHSRR